MSNNTKIPWNTQKTPTKHVLRPFEKFLKIRFSAQKSGSWLRYRTMLKCLETLRKHQLNMFWGFSRNFLKIWIWAKKSGSRPRCRTMLKFFETLREHEQNMFEAFWEILENPVLGSNIRFSAQISNYAKIPWNTQKTPTKHVLRLFKKFFKIRFSSRMSNNAKKYFETHPKNTNKTCFQAFWEILENPVLNSNIWFSAHISNYAKIPWNTQKTPTKHVLRLFKKFLKNPVLGSKIRFSAQMSNNAKNTLKH